PDQPWKLLKAGDSVPAGSLVIGAGGYLESNSGAVHVHFAAGASFASKFPVMEGGIRVLPPGDADLSLAVDRGRVELGNATEEGAARVNLATREGFLDLPLKEPGTHVILERYGRFPAGTHFRANKPAANAAGPVLARMLAVTKGAVSLAYQGKTVELTAPPG